MSGMWDLVVFLGGILWDVVRGMPWWYALVALVLVLAKPVSKIVKLYTKG